MLTYVSFTRRDTVNEDNNRPQEVLHFSSNVFGELAVHQGKSLGEGHQSGAASHVSKNVICLFKFISFLVRFRQV